MKTNRRQFFATLLAPLLGRHIPKPLFGLGPIFVHKFFTSSIPIENFGESGLSEEDFDFTASVDWPAGVPTLIPGTFIPPTLVREATRVSQEYLKLQLLKSKKMTECK